MTHFDASDALTVCCLSLTEKDGRSVVEGGGGSVLDPLRIDLGEDPLLHFTRKRGKQNS